MSTSIGMVTGSFDPFTLGHSFLIEEASIMFDKLYVAIANNPNKQYFLTVEERIQIIESSLHDLNISNAQIILVPNGVLTVQVAETHDVDYLVRGIRTSEDFVYEMNLCRSNQSISQSIGTVFLPSPIQVSHISSSYVKEIISCHPHWDEFLLSRSILTEKAVEIIKKKLTPQEIV